jgi:ubiquinone/menaquinone biosynthesis C-methylase UbiE
MRRSQRFFNKVSSHYQDLFRQRITSEKFNVRKAIVEPRIGERVLDVGNGGVRGIYPPQTSFYVGTDFSLEMLKKGGDRTYYKVCGDAINLPFKQGGFNTILYFFLLHHLAQGSTEATIEAVKKALREGFLCLKTGGNIIIAETCVPSFLEKVERAFFFILKVFLFFTRQSEVFLFSAETLTRILSQCGYKQIRTWEISTEKEGPWTWVPIAIVFTHLKIPRWTNPSRIMIFEVRN